MLYNLKIIFYSPFGSSPDGLKLTKGLGGFLKIRYMDNLF